MSAVPIPERINHQRLQGLLGYGTTLLQQEFLLRWYLFTGVNWEDNTSNLNYPLGKQSLGKWTRNVNLLISRYNYREPRFYNLGHDQQDVIIQGDVAQWDITVLTGILLNVNLKVPDWIIYEGHVKELRKVKNSVLSHNPRVHAGSYDVLTSAWQRAEPALLYFGAKPVKLVKFRDADFKNLNKVMNQDVRIVNNTNVATALELMSKAESLRNDYESACNLYTKALQLENIDDETTGKLSTAIAETRLAIIDKEVKPTKTIKENKYCTTLAERALAHSSEAVDRLPTSFAAHLVKAKVHIRLDQLDEADYHLEFAHALAPEEKKVSKLLSECKHRLLQSEVKPKASTVMDAAYSRQQALNSFVQQVGSEVVTSSGYLAQREERRKEEDEVNPGNKWLLGIDGHPQDYKRAAQFFETAANSGNAEAMYQLAVMHEKRYGIDSDYEASNLLLQQAAATEDKTSSGVAEALFALGVKYQEGLGFPRDYKKAAEFYKQASENGFGEASNNLAFLYYKGRGVNLNILKGVGYTRLAALQGASIAMLFLARFYLASRQPDLAKIWWKHALNHDSRITVEENADFEQDVRALVETENENPTLGPLEVLSAFEKYAKRTFKSPKLSCIQEIQPFDQAYLDEKIAHGSSIAKDISDACGHFQKATKLVESYFPGYVEALAKCFRKSNYVAVFDLTEKEQLEKKLMAQIQQEKGGISEADLDARVCLASLINNDHKSNAAFIEASGSKYPGELVFHDQLLKRLKCMGDFDKAREFLNESLIQFPQNPTLLYKKAVIMQNTIDSCPDQAIQAFQAFLKVAPMDHPKCPRAYFLMATLASKQSPGSDDVLKYYTLGIESEKDQLAPLLDYHKNARVKAEVGRALKACELKGNNIAPTPGTSFSSSSRAPQTPEVTADKRMQKTAILTSPHRAYIIKKYRSSVEKREVLATVSLSTLLGVNVKQRQFAPCDADGEGWAALDRITIVEMDPVKACFYQNRVLCVTIIENAVGQDHKPGTTTVSMLVEDENQDIAPFWIECPTSGLGCLHALGKGGYGVKMAIANPYFEAFGEGTFRIMVEDPKSIRVTSKPNPLRCRFCGKDGAPKSCSKCKISKYCGVSCQTEDWKELGHQNICKVYAASAPRTSSD